MKLFKFIFIYISYSFILFSQESYQSKLIFPLQSQHVHGSSIVELPNGDLLACWFQGSGERSANDVAIKGSRLKKGDKNWSEIFTMADTPNQPDCNPVLFLNKDNKLFLVWIVVQANKWETSILKFRTSSDYLNTVIPNWEWQDIILLKPGDDFVNEIETKFKDNTHKEFAWSEYAPIYERMIFEAAKDPKKRETGWMTRIHPLILDNGRILLPLYSDGYNISICAISDDNGENWYESLPIVGKGNIQPSFVQKEDKTIVAYMRDSGDEPGRIMMAESKDNGESWSFANDSEIPNPGASVESIKLKSGNWLLIYNDLEDGRYSLAAAISDDEGKTWKWKKHLENSKEGGFSYPSVIQSKEGKINVTYSYHIGREKRSIKHVAFDENWIIE
ncbi:MAG: exo-alpha-sialidase [Ignavibacteriales bacterium]|nr:exo-alpha-sialidase [Ignavibacteriales bacterium]